MWSPSFGIPSYSWNVIPNRLCSIYWVSITFNQNIQSTSSGLRFQLWQLDTTMSLQAGRKIMSISTSRSWTWSNCLGDVTLSPKDEIPWNSIKWVWNLIFPIWIDRSWDKFPSPIFLINPSQSHSHIVLACIGYIYTISYTCKQITYIYICKYIPSNPHPITLLLNPSVWFFFQDIFPLLDPLPTIRWTPRCRDTAFTICSSGSKSDGRELIWAAMDVTDVTDITIRCRKFMIFNVI